MSKQLLCALSLVGLVSACGGDSDPKDANTGGTAGTAGTGGSGTGGSGATSSGGNGGTGGDSYSVTVGPIAVESGYENTQCVVMRLGNPAGFKVGRFDNVISSSSHHMIVYRTKDTEEKLTPFDCSPFVETLDPTKGSPVMITQKAEDTLQLPPGVAYTFDENQMLRLELHYINTKPSTEQVTATATFTAIPDQEYQHEADFIFIGDLDVSIPPNAAATVGPTYFPLPGEFDGVNFFALTGHTHRFGTNVTIATAPSASGADTPVYDVPGWKWDEPATVQHSPPFQVPQNGGFRFQCDYQNTTSQQVTFGESANKEMCFFWAYYYPSKGARVCFHTTQGGVPLTSCCPGGALCNFF